MAEKSDILKQINNYTSKFRKSLKNIKIDPNYKSKYLPNAKRNELLQKMGMANYYEGVYGKGNTRLDKIQGDDDAAAYLRFLYSFLNTSERKDLDDYFETYTIQAKKMGFMPDELHNEDSLKKMREYRDLGDKFNATFTIATFEEIIYDYISTKKSFQGVDITPRKGHTMYDQFLYWKHEYDVLPQAFDKRLEEHFTNYIGQVSNIIGDKRIIDKLKEMGPKLLYEATLQPSDKSSSMLPTFFEYYNALKMGSAQHIEELNQQFADFFNIKNMPDSRSIQRRLGNREIFVKQDEIMKRFIQSQLLNAAENANNPNMRPLINFKGVYTVPFLGSEKGSNTFSQFLRDYFREHPEARKVDPGRDYSK